ncbi:hypothetical protein SPHINGOR109_10680 [Sphingorhabdus sp. 109]|jgi:hypothetical protein|nr:hypothetical protein SPHINGOR109_10680 [Sphingorhabdus sp. 109]
MRDLVSQFRISHRITTRKWVTDRHTIREASQVQGADVIGESRDFGVWNYGDSLLNALIRCELSVIANLTPFTIAKHVYNLRITVTVHF